MNQASINSQVLTDAMLFAGLPASVTGPAFMYRPPIRVPRSAVGNYSESELETAASMLNKLRCRDDQKILARSEQFEEAEHAVDVTVDRLLRVLQT